MKQPLLILTAVIVVLCLTSCSNDTEEPVDETSYRLDTLSIAVAELRTQVNQLDSICREVSKAVATLKTKPGELEDKIGKSEEEISHLRASILQMTFRLDDLEKVVRYIESRP